MPELTVELAGKEYPLRPKSIAQARAWRQKLQGPFGELASLLTTGAGVNLTDVSGVGGLVEIVNRVLLGSTDLILELVYEWSPEISADREQIEAVATDEQALDVFLKILRVAYPFGKLVEALAPAAQPARPSGQKGRSTAKS